MPKNIIAGLHSSYYLVAIGTAKLFFSQVLNRFCDVFPAATGSDRVSLLRHLHEMSLFHVSHSEAVWWCCIVDLICISLMTNHIKHPHVLICE